jgi:hypothetical protein
MAQPPKGNISDVFETVGGLIEARDAAASKVNSGAPAELQVNCEALTQANQAVLAADQEAAKIPQMSPHLSDAMSDPKSKKALQTALKKCPKP